MSLPPIMLYPGGRARTPPRPADPARRQGRAPILTAQGTDIRELVESAAAAASIPAGLLLACLMAESELNERAERWGGGPLTAQAKAAIAAGDNNALRTVIAQPGNDVSFGLGQRIVKFHYHGNHQLTVENCLAVRQFVFAHVDQDVREAARFLAPRLTDARGQDLSPCGGDELLGALAAYNHGHYPAPGDVYWHERAGTVQRYKDKLALARQALGA
jgi:hypothetical protein